MQIEYQNAVPLFRTPPAKQITTLAHCRFFNFQIFSKRYNLKFADDLPGASKKTEKKVASANSGNGESKLDVSGGEPLPGTGMVRTESMSTTESYEGDNDGLDEEDDFVEALESLDLTHPSNLKLYTGKPDDRPTRTRYQVL